MILFERIFVFPARFPPRRLRIDDPKAALFLNEGACGCLGFSAAGVSIFEINFSYPLFLPTGEESLGELGYFLLAITLEKPKGTTVPCACGLFKVTFV